MELVNLTTIRKVLPSVLLSQERLSVFSSDRSAEVRGSIRMHTDKNNCKRKSLATIIEWLSLKANIFIEKITKLCCVGNFVQENILLETVKPRNQQL